MNLVETKAAFVTPEPVLERVKTGEHERLRVRGIYGRAEARNENNRKYPLGVWEQNLGEDSSLQKRLGARAVLGQLEHPESGITHLGHVSHLIESAQLLHLEPDNDFGVEEGDYVIGSHLVLNTPPGQILRELYEMKVPVGVSSRGRGDVIADAEGVDVVQDNYEADTWDCVYQPSVVEATPVPIQEAQELNVQTLIAEAQTAITDQADVVRAVELSYQIAEAQRQMSGSDPKYNDDMRRSLASCGQKLEAVVKDTICSAKAPSSAVSQSPKKIHVRSARVETKTKTAALLGSMVERTVRAEATAARLTEGRTTPPPTRDQLRRGGGRPRPGTRPRPKARTTQEVVEKRRYDALLEVADGLLKKGRLLKTKVTEVTKRAEAATALAEGLAAKVRGRSVSDVVEAAIAEAPELEPSKKLLLECTSSKEVADKIRLIKTISPAQQPTETPAETIVESISVPAGGGGKPAVRGAMDLSEALFDRKGV